VLCGRRIPQTRDGPESGVRHDDIVTAGVAFYVQVVRDTLTGS
jgi:hypothetical protein